MLQRSRRIRWKNLLIIYTVTSLVTTIIICYGKEANIDDPLECDVYIAESTIPNAGLGVFTAVEKKVGDMVGNGDVCFPLLELDWHNGVILDPDSYFFDPFADYVWDGMTLGKTRNQ